jgi:hypothetical protein
MRRKGDVCLYSQSGEIGIYAYEVFKVRKLPKRHINGRILEAMEVTPSKEQWGKKGFSCNSLYRAMQTFEELCKRRESRQSMHLSTMQEKIA